MFERPIRPEYWTYKEIPNGFSMTPVPGPIYWDKSRDLVRVDYDIQNKAAFLELDDFTFITQHRPHIADWVQEGVDKLLEVE